MHCKSKGNLLVAFIILIAMSAIVLSILSLVGIRVRESGVKVSEFDSFYVAEAGLNKAIWYLATPVAQGGKGTSWRDVSYYEPYGWGGYYLTVQDTATSGEVQIISTGEVGGIMKTVSQIVDTSGVPDAFNYAIFSNAALNLSGSANIQGDIFINGNTVFSGSASVTDGYVYHPVGTTISGGGTYTDGGEPNPVPTFPNLDTSYYSSLISVAQGMPSGDQNYSNTTVDLNGGTVYINGSVNVSGSTTFNGPGVVVATGTLSFSGNTYTTSNVKFISNGAIGASGNMYTDDAIYYSSTSISASGNTRVNVGGFLSTGTLNLSGNINVSGIVYSVGQITLSGNPAIRGSMVSGSLLGVQGISGNTNIIHDQSVFPDELPPGFPSTSVSKVTGTWKGD